MKPGMILYREELSMLLIMQPEEQAEAIRLLAKRFLLGEEPETDNYHVELFLQIAIPKQEADEKGYEAKVNGASKGGKATQGKVKHTLSIPQAYLNKQEQEPKQEQESKQEQEPKPKQGNGETRARVFRPPTVEEVREYCQSRGNRISAERFVDHYSANGWKVGKNPMKDWKAAVRNWEKNDFSKDIDNTSISGFDYDQLEALARKRGLE